MSRHRIDQDNGQFITDEYSGSDSEEVRLFFIILFEKTDYSN